MKEIPLTQGRVALVDDEDFNAVNQFKWYAKFDTYTIYATRTFGTPFQKNQTTVRMHRFILNAPTGFDVDHIDGDGLNNCRDNIRVVTRRQNNQNIHKITSSKYTGVTLIKSSGKWQSQIKVDGKYYFLGNFESEECAHQRYLAELHKYGLVNVPGIGEARAEKALKHNSIRGMAGMKHMEGLTEKQSIKVLAALRWRAS